MGKLSFVVGIGIGYVLGTRAGRARYEQMKRQAGKVWNSDPVQARVSQATETVKQQTGPYLADKFGDAVKAMGQAIKDQQSGSSSSSTPATQPVGVNGTTELPTTS